MGLAPFFFVDSNSSWKDVLFPQSPNLVQKPLYVVGTVLKCFDNYNQSFISQAKSTYQ